MFEMFNTGATEAPVWFNYVSKRDAQDRPLAKRYHAEDGAYFLMESTLNPKPTANYHYENIMEEGGKAIYLSIWEREIS
jgi:hypothetical protein